MVSIVPTVQPPFLPPAMPPPVHASVHAPAPVYQAVLITSQHGLQQWALQQTNRGTPVLCVGGASADLAKALGFVRVEAAAGDADSLASLVIARLSPQAGALVHPTGQGFRHAGLGTASRPWLCGRSAKAVSPAADHRIAR
jgi:uroporphyrinogen-III synthase